jgi:hypothetical protein
MPVPISSDLIWIELITGDKKIDFDFLAIKIFLGTAQRLYAIDPESLSKSALNLYKLFEKNQMLPTVQKDLQKLK